jgi:hypothetical protein
VVVVGGGASESIDKRWVEDKRELSVEVEERSDSVDNLLTSDDRVGLLAVSSPSVISNKRFNDFSRSTICPSNCDSENVLVGTFWEGGAKVEDKIAGAGRSSGEGNDDLDGAINGGGKTKGLAARGKDGGPIIGLLVLALGLEIELPIGTGEVLGEE